MRRPMYLLKLTNSQYYQLNPFMYTPLPMNTHKRFRDIKEILACRGIVVSYESIRQWCCALRDIGSNTPHITEQYKNNIAEVSHQKTRQQQRQMRQFKSIAQAQRFLANHGVINNHFRQQRHLLKAKHYREIRGRAFEQWTQITCAQNLVINS